MGEHAVTIDRQIRRERAERFRALHHGDDPLILFNAWDVASAQAIAKSSPAVATSSAAVAASRGYADGEDLPLDVVIEFVERVTSRVDVPVSVDFEAGYGSSADEVAVAVGALTAAGAVGVNLEDGLVAGERKLADPALHAAKIAAARKAGDKVGVHLFINARTDPFWLKLGSAEECMTMALRRAECYAEAGADGMFVPRLLDLRLIERFARDVPIPLNILAMPGGPSIAELRDAGVKRVSLGSWPMRASVGWVEATSRSIVTEQTLDSLAANAS